MDSSGAGAPGVGLMERFGVCFRAHRTQLSSLITAPVGRYAEMPEVFYELIESYFPSVPRIELNARQRCPGCDVWVPEAPPDDAATAASRLPGKTRPTGEPHPADAFARPARSRTDSIFSEAVDRVPWLGWRALDRLRLPKHSR